ncbi:MAG: hypothetical protein LBO06_04185 [Bacteroidales bacterium]|jgi:hypothetical protein|nr:hypothetical protein [Bacteroidales bacterium]
MKILTNNLQLQKVFATIVEEEITKNYVRDIALLVGTDKLSTGSIQIILDKYGINSLLDIKIDLLSLLIAYAKIILTDDNITETEKATFKLLTRLFKIKEGDFYKYKTFELSELLHLQFEKLYSDNIITNEESLHNFDIQDIFSLSYAQFETLRENEIKIALDRGANITHLDTANTKYKVKQIK